jgi:iron(II)-dependent oxidoreductase
MAIACLAASALTAGCSAGAPPAPSGLPSPSTFTPAAPTGAPSPGRAAGTARTDAHGIEQVWVPGGTFTMGSAEGSAAGPAWAQPGFDSEHPAHEVRITAGYWIDATEVTVEAYADFVDDGGYDAERWWSPDGWAWRQGQSIELPAECVEGGQAPDEPRVCVTFWEAEAYATWRGGRLPTEAEWEFAARGPESRVYPWGDEFDPDLANLDGATGLAVVGSFPGGASWVGAQDLAGNAMEWVADWWSLRYYSEAIRDDPTGPETGARKVEKGGWWGPPDDAGAFIARSSYRHYEDPPTYFDHHIGFRIVSPS